MSESASRPLELSDVSDPDLRSLESALERGDLTEPITATSLLARGFKHLASKLTPYMGPSRAALQAVVGAVLAERAHRKAPKLTLVWTGEDPGIGHTRYNPHRPA